jgi:hypothetical protein
MGWHKGGYMNELIDFQGMWNKAVDTWKNNLGCILFAVAMFFAGMVLQNKIIVDDCKFSKSFRDGATVYDCQVRIR